MPHLVQSAPAGQFNGADRIHGEAGCLSKDLGGRLSLDNHGGHQLSDLALQVASEAGALFGDGELGTLLSLGPEAIGGDL